MNDSQFIPSYSGLSAQSGSTRWQAPSNIALVKYWGKKEVQIPMNPSISFTLSECRTETQLDFRPKAEGVDWIGVELDGEAQPGFVPKIETFFARIERYLPFLKDHSFRIRTHNTFPHSSGIASSASGMGALAACLVAMEEQLSGLAYAADARIKKISFLARLGSGSACRSMQGPLVVWGEHPSIANSSDLFGVRFEGIIHPAFDNYRDTILLVDVGEKQVSSTAGHGLMHGHPFAEARFAEANKHLGQLPEVLEKGDLDRFIEIVELEALQLHAMMLTSSPYFILMKPNTLAIINAIWDYRKQSGSKLCFTLDAGANVHLLYPDAEASAVQAFIADVLAAYCKNGAYIHDRCGEGVSAF